MTPVYADPTGLDRVQRWPSTDRALQVIAALAVTEAPLIAVVRRGTIARFFDDSILGEDLADFLETELRPPGLAAARIFCLPWLGMASLCDSQACRGLPQHSGDAGHCGRT